MDLGSASALDPIPLFPLSLFLISVVIAVIWRERKRGDVLRGL